VTAPRNATTARERDPRAAVATLDELHGKPLLRADFSYGDELQLNFGQAVPEKRLPGKTRGEWILGLRGTEWALLAESRLLARSTDERERALKGFAEVEGRTLVEARVRDGDAALVLRFDGGASFLALTDLEPAEYPELDLWELFTPTHALLVARPDATLEIVDARTALTRPPS
jgi:hypothetical protein